MTVFVDCWLKNIRKSFVLKKPSNLGCNNERNVINGFVNDRQMEWKLKFHFEMFHVEEIKKYFNNFPH